MHHYNSAWYILRCIIFFFYVYGQHMMVLSASILSHVWSAACHKTILTSICHKRVKYTSYPNNFAISLSFSYHYHYYHLFSFIHTQCAHFLHDCFLCCGVASEITSLTIVYSTVHSGADQRKHQSSTSLDFVTGEFPAQMASNAVNVSIWWRHHSSRLFSCHWESHRRYPYLHNEIPWDAALKNIGMITQESTNDC